MSARSIVIYGLRRSGTTILWETLRKDSSTLCFDEPFHPRLWEGERQNAKNTWDELGEYWERNSPQHTHLVQCITSQDELSDKATQQQISYLRDLMRQGQRTAIDIVRGWNKATALLPPDIEAVAVLLLRPPIDWVTAHLLPSGSGTWKKEWADKYRRHAFFSRTGHFNNWQYEEIIDAALKAHHPMWEALPLSTSQLKSEPAFVKLLAFWWCANLITYRQLQSRPSSRFHVVTLADFTADPAGQMIGLYKIAGWDLTADGLGYDHVSAPRSAWKSDAPEWHRAFELLGLPPELQDSSKFTASFVEKAFQGAAENVS